jgi:hypothetical protein
VGGLRDFVERFAERGGGKRRGSKARRGSGEWAQWRLWRQPAYDMINVIQSYSAESYDYTPVLRSRADMQSMKS